MNTIELIKVDTIMTNNSCREKSSSSKSFTHKLKHNGINHENSERNIRKRAAMATGLIIRITSTLRYSHLISVLVNVLLWQTCLSWYAKPVAAVASIRSGPQSTEHCAIVLDGALVQKEVGSFWISPKDPCAIHSCEIDKKGAVHETVVNVDCEQFYCDVDSEVRPQAGTCCGKCVRTKCRFNDTVYEVNQTWHNAEDCLLFECVQLGDGQSMINTYKKSCPPLPPDCAPQDVYVKECCHYCNTSRFHDGRLVSARSEALTESAKDIWTADFYRNHPCARECQQNAPPMTCRYNFEVEWYETLSKACYSCPQNASHCERPHCILADGIRRSVMVVNRMMPGPALEVCEGDMVVVDVHNNLLGETTTIHWHGMHQKQYPYMDGVPHVSQCPIAPHSSFRYQFRAENAGTHFWHSHTGMQRGDGVFGALVVRRSRDNEIHGRLYDFDLSEHIIILQDWVHQPGTSVFTSHHHSRGDNKPVNLLVNGRGRYYKAIWEKEKEKEKEKESRANNPLENETSGNIGKTEAQNNESNIRRVKILNEQDSQPELTESFHLINATREAYPKAYPEADVEILYSLASLNQTKMRIKDAVDPVPHLINVSSMHDATQNASTSSTLDVESEPEETTLMPSPSTIEIVSDDSVSRAKRSLDNDDDILLHQMPLQIFSVRPGFRYRFRIINAEFLNCPISLSIDNHTLTAINSDGYDFEAVDVGSIVTYAGERFDFIVHSNQPVGNYWMRLKGLMDCSELYTSAFQVAILRYEGADAVEPNSWLGYHHKADGIELNVMNRGPGHADTMTIAELNAVEQYDSVSGVDRDALKPVADYKFFVYYDFYAKDNPEFHPSEYYGFNDSVGSENKLFTPQLNHISFKFPSNALLPSRQDIDDSVFCNETSLAAQGIDCREVFCKCHHVLQVELNSVVELIVVDEGFTYDANHPFHLHGNAFRVVGLERLATNVTIDMVKQLDRYNLLKRNLNRPPVKDTVTVPDGGYTILRFEASNPGYWLFHCHIEFHAEIGMALIIKVGDNDQMQPVPKNFPSCHDYVPSAEDEHINNTQPTVDEATLPAGANAAVRHCQATVVSILILLLAFLRSF